MADPRLLPAGIRDASNTALARLMDGPGDIDLTPLLVLHIDTAPAAVLPDLVDQFAVQDMVSPDMDEGTVRRILKSAFKVHRYRGTRWAVEQSLTDLGLAATITEWFEAVPEAEPYTFTVTVRLNDNIRDGDPLVTPRRIAQAETAVIRSKSKRSDFTIHVTADHSADTRTAATVLPRVHVDTPGTASLRIRPAPTVGMGVSIVNRQVVKIRRAVNG